MPAVAAAVEHVHDVGADLLVDAADGLVGDGAEDAGAAALRHGQFQGAHDHVADALRDLRGAAGDGCGQLGVEEGALRNVDSERLEAAGVDRDFGVDMPEAQVAG